MITHSMTKSWTQDFHGYQHPKNDSFQRRIILLIMVRVLPEGSNQQKIVKHHHHSAPWSLYLVGANI